MNTKLETNEIYIVELSYSFELQYYVDKKEDIPELIKTVTQYDIYDIIYDRMEYSDDEAYIRYNYKEKNHHAVGGYSDEHITILKLTPFKNNTKTFNEFGIVYVTSNSDLDTNLIYCSNKKDILSMIKQFIDSENTEKEKYEINITHTSKDYIEYTAVYTIFDTETYYDEYDRQLEPDTYEKEYYISIIKTLKPIKIKNRIKKI